MGSMTMPRESSLDAAVVTHKGLAEQVRQMFPGEDEESLADTVEGLTTIDEAITAVVRAALEREAMAKALGELIEGMTNRKARLLAGAQSMRAAALNAMQECGLKKLQAPDMSLSANPGKAKLVITDEARVPDEFVKVERSLKKKEIAAWLGELDPMSQPDWVTWGNPQPFLQIHRR